MQNKENGFGRFVKEKGYYIVLLLCAVAIGVSGYLLLSGKNSASCDKYFCACSCNFRNIVNLDAPVNF